VRAKVREGSPGGGSHRMVPCLAVAVLQRFFLGGCAAWLSEEWRRRCKKDAHRSALS